MSSGALSNLEIKQELKKGNVIIEPFNEEQLSNASYDVTLGPYYYCYNRQYPYKVFNPWNDDHRVAFWEKQYRVGIVIDTDALVERYGAKLGSVVIVIPPRETILAHTMEFIGGRKFITTKMQARSTIGRCCITMCKCAGLGDIGFYSRYTLEIENTGLHELVLVVGQPVAQIIFVPTGGTDTPYSVKGSYQVKDTTSRTPEEEIRMVMASWKPEHMLPRLKIKPMLMSIEEEIRDIIKKVTGLTIPRLEEPKKEEAKTS